MTSLSLNYFGLLSWTRHKTVDEPVFDPDRGIAGWRHEVSSVEPQTVDLDDGYQLTFGGRAIADGPPDRRTILTPLNVRVTSSERHPLDNHLQRLDAVHALLSLAHHDHVTAAAGFARLDAGDTGRNGTLLWDRTMMSDNDSPDINEFPIFTLDDINGLEGVAAWVRTCLQHNRSVTPLVRHRLFDNQTPESRLLSTATAIDNWVSAAPKDARVGESAHEGRSQAPQASAVQGQSRPQPVRVTRVGNGVRRIQSEGYAHEVDPRKRIL